MTKLHRKRAVNHKDAKKTTIDGVTRPTELETCRSNLKAQDTPQKQLQFQLGLRPALLAQIVQAPPCLWPMGDRKGGKQVAAPRYDRQGYNSDANAQQTDSKRVCGHCGGERRANTFSRGTTHAPLASESLLSELPESGAPAATPASPPGP